MSISDEIASGVFRGLIRFVLLCVAIVAGTFAVVVTGIWLTGS